MKSQQKLVIFSAIGLILFFLVTGAMYKNQQSNEISNKAKENALLLERPYSYSIGNKDAKVHLVEFFDPACETCAQFKPLVEKIMEDNKDKIRLTLRYAPYHSGSDYVVKMLEAARKQGKFEETLEMMFATQEYWASHHQPKPQVLWQFLPKLGLDIDQLVIDMKDPKLDDLIKQDLADAKILGATKTPSYFVNGKPLQKFGYKQLKELIYSEL
jgi:protein-disulfide isomerase